MRTNLNFFQWRSLKFRVTLFTLAIFVSGIWSLEFYASRMLREDIQRLLGEQQFSIASLLATEIDAEIEQRMAALKSSAASVSPAMLADTAALQAFVEQSLLLRNLFNGGVIAYRADGTAIAEAPLEVGRVGTNYMDRDYLAGALTNGKATIGRPRMGPKLKAPVFVMAVPVHDAGGKVIGALGGVVNLGLPNFLDRIAGYRQGKTGGSLLVASGYRLVITASDKRRIMEVLPAPGRNTLIDRFIDGYEGSALVVNPQGVEVLASARRVPSAGWYAAVVLPSAEAFAPIHDMEQRMLIATMLLTLLAGGVTWWMLSRQLSPMLAAARVLAMRSDTNQVLQPLPVAGQDEIGQLIGGFNHLLEALAQREVALRESEERFRSLTEMSSDFYWESDAEHRLVTRTESKREAAEAVFHEAPSIGKRRWEIAYLSPDESGWQKHRALLEAHLPFRDFEISRPRASGAVHHISVSGDPVFDAVGNFKGYRGVGTDITRRKQQEERTRQLLTENETILDNALVGIAYLKQRRIVSCNRRFEEIFHYAHGELIGESSERLYDMRETFDHIGVVAYAAVAQNRIYSTEVKLRRKDGSVFWGAVNGRAVDPARPHEGSIWIYADISELKQAEADLRIAASAFESQESMVITDADNVILRVNRAFTEITGYSAEEVVGQTPRLLRSDRSDEAFFIERWEVIRRTGRWQGEVWNRRKNGEVYPVWVTTSAVTDADGTVTHYISSHIDITERKQAEEKINQLAFYDPLTGLANRRLLLDRLHQALASSTRSGRHGALLFVDLDNFKTLNDTLGHDTGDLLLQQVARRLVTCVREGDTVARLGGDEFLVMLEDLSDNSQEAATQTETVGEKILATLNRTYQLAGTSYRSTPSIGLTLFMDHQGSTDELLKRADLAMYQAKAAGRNTLRFFDPEMQAVVMARAALEADFREAIVKGQFVLHYQAQVAGAGRLTGAEALVRWQHPQRGLVPPGEFIPMAEETGLILPLGQWVLETACAQLATWAGQAQMAQLTVAVNVSARQFRHVDFVEKVVAVLDRTGANPQRLKLELTESLLVENVEDVIAKMTALKARGVGFALDDFGTGYSSLSHLKRLPLDQLKIDQGFVRDILTDPNDAAIAKMIVALAESMALSVIAEGVEVEAQRVFLARHGCHAYQGYLFSRPLPLDEFGDFVARPRTV